MLAVVCAGIAVTLTLHFKREYEHRQWVLKVNDLLTEMRSLPPSGVDKNEWDYLVSWTINLHANTASMTGDITDTERKQKYLVELRERLSSRPSLDTIEWIWHEYTQFTWNGEAYRLKHIPTDLIQNARQQAQRKQ